MWAPQGSFLLSQEVPSDVLGEMLGESLFQLERLSNIVSSNISGAQLKEHPLGVKVSYLLHIQVFLNYFYKVTVKRRKSVRVMINIRV